MSGRHRPTDTFAGGRSTLRTLGRMLLSNNVIYICVRVVMLVCVATYPSEGGRREAHGCVFQERKMRGVATIQGKHRKNRKGVVYEL